MRFPNSPFLMAPAMMSMFHLGAAAAVADYGRSHGGTRQAAGQGRARAAARLAAHRKAQAERLKDAAAPVETRQQRRRNHRYYKKWYLTPTQEAYEAMTGSFPTYPKSTFAHRA